MNTVEITDDYGDSILVTAPNFTDNIYVRVLDQGGQSSVAVSLSRQKVKELRRELKRLLQESKV